MLLAPAMPAAPLALTLPAVPCTPPVPPLPPPLMITPPPAPASPVPKPAELPPLLTGPLPDVLLPAEPGVPALPAGVPSGPPEQAMMAPAVKTERHAPTRNERSGIMGTSRPKGAQSASVRMTAEARRFLRCASDEGEKLAEPVSAGGQPPKTNRRETPDRCR